MPRPIRTFLDSGVLIAAFKGTPHMRESALRILEDPARVFLTSPFIRLEVLPKAVFNKQFAESRFYEQFFSQSESLNDLPQIFDIGEREAARSGVGSMDSLHIAAAHLLQTDEFVTTGGRKKSIHRSTLVNIVTLQD